MPEALSPQQCAEIVAACDLIIGWDMEGLRRTLEGMADRDEANRRIRLDSALRENTGEPKPPQSPEVVALIQALTKATGGAHVMGTDLQLPISKLTAELLRFIPRDDGVASPAIREFYIHPGVAGGHMLFAFFWQEGMQAVSELKIRVVGYLQLAKKPPENLNSDPRSIGTLRERGRISDRFAAQRAHDEKQRTEDAARWRADIESSPTHDSAMLKSIVDGLRRMKDLTRMGRTDVEIERLSMDHLCKAIRAGAFSGPEWFPWRTALASNPHISAAHTLLDVFPPPKTYARPHSPPGIIYGVAAAFILADMIEPFISEGRPIKKRGAPVQFDPRDDTKVYNAWHTGQYRTYAECAKALGAGSTPKSVEKAIDRHEKRLKNQSRQA